MRIKSLLTVGLAGLVLAGCASTGPNEGMGTVGGAVIGGLVGSTIGQGSGKLAATAAGAVIGGLVGQAIGRDLDEQERRRAREAEFEALEYGRPGTPIGWRGDRDGNYGEVVPGPRYRVNTYDCRDYTHRIYIDGEPQVARGTACRQPDGTWRPVN